MSYSVQGQSVIQEKQASTVDPDFHPQINLPGIRSQLETANIIEERVERKSSFMDSVSQHKWLILAGVVAVFVLKNRKNE